MRRFLAVLTMFLLYFSIITDQIYAQDVRNDAFICDKNLPALTWLVFSNGTFNDIYDSEKSLLELRKKLKIALSSTQMQTIQFCIAYNQTESLLDLFQAVRQKLAGGASEFWRWLAHIDPLPDFFQDAAQSIALSIDQLQYVIDADLQQHVTEIYQPALHAGKKIIVVPHSQGNFYANEAYRRVFGHVDPVAHFKIISVANPDSFVAGSGPYTTLKSDLIIVPIPGALSPNTENNDRTLLGHDFINDYLSQSSHSERQILSHLLAALQLPILIADTTKSLHVIGIPNGFTLTEGGGGSPGPIIFGAENARGSGLYLYSVPQGIQKIATGNPNEIALLRPNGLPDGRVFFKKTGPQGDTLYLYTPGQRTPQLVVDIATPLPDLGIPTHLDQPKFGSATPILFNASNALKYGLFVYTPQHGPQKIATADMNNLSDALDTNRAAGLPDGRVLFRRTGPQGDTLYLYTPGLGTPQPIAQHNQITLPKVTSTGPLLFGMNNGLYTYDLPQGIQLIASDISNVNRVNGLPDGRVLFARPSVHGETIFLYTPGLVTPQPIVAPTDILPELGGIPNGGLVLSEGGSAGPILFGASNALGSGLYMYTAQQQKQKIATDIPNSGLLDYPHAIGLRDGSVLYTGPGAYGETLYLFPGPLPDTQSCSQGKPCPRCWQLGTLLTDCQS